MTANRSLWATTLVTLAALLPVGTVAQTTVLTFVPTEAEFANPERGFYAHREVQAEGPPMAAGDLNTLRTAGITVVLRLYYLRSFRDRPLSQAQLDLFVADMTALRAAGVKAVLRFAYSQHETEPDAPLDIVLGHIAQLQPLFEAHSDVVAVVQAGFLGTWGEWHHSTTGTNTTEARRATTEALLAAFPTDRFLQVRTPFYKRDIFDRSDPITPAEAHTGENVARVGHHNDCFLASADDYGTFPTQADRDFTAADTRFSPSGGETCNPNPPRSECPTALTELATFHYSYLNRDYHPAVLASWIAGDCMPEVRRRLGYRLALTSGQVTTAARPGVAFHLTLAVENHGWAAPFNPRPVEVVLRHTVNGERYVARLSDDPRFWEAGLSATVDAIVGLPSDLPTGDYNVLLNLPDGRLSLYERPQFSIRLANEGLWEEETGYNNLGAVLSVTSDGPGEPYTGPLVFRPYSEVVGVGQEEPDGVGSLGLPFPNPTSGSLNIPFTTVGAGLVHLAVYDALGRLVAEPVRGLRPPGNYAAALSTRGWAPGVYTVRFETVTGAESRRVVVTQ